MENTLKANSLGTVESVIIGIAGTAYSIEITTSTITGSPSRSSTSTGPWRTPARLTPG